MKRLCALAMLSLILTVPTLIRAEADGVVSGSWKLTKLAPDGASQVTNFVFKLETTDGKTTATLVAADPSLKDPKISGFSMTDGRVRLALTYTGGKGGKGGKGGGKKGKQGGQVFEGYVTPDGKGIVGVFSQTTPAYMAPTDLKELDPKGTVGKLSTEELKHWAQNSTRLASQHNAPWAVPVHLKFAEVFLTRKEAGMAVEHAVAAEKALGDKASTQQQVKVLEMVSKAVTARLTKLELTLDAEYLAAVPPFKAQPFGRRKGESKRVAVMELFTGAQCGPCIAADVACDALLQTYKSSELVLLEYHLHIPGPDPLTNADTEARAKYYRAKSTPSTFFNGKSKGGGGGDMTASEKKYRTYSAVIDPLLENPAVCKISASATRDGDMVSIQATVTDVEKPGSDLKLRLVLVEEKVRFVGANKIRFHHQVVRAMPGGVAGIAVTKDTLTAKQEVNLVALRGQLTNYLDNYEATVNFFRQPQRPMSMENLRVIALVQDDATREILQAVQVEVKE